MSGTTTIGSGSDIITVNASGDAYGTPGAPGADAEFTLNVDGQQIGGLQDVAASHAAGQEQTFAFAGNFDPGPHTVTITFANNSGTQGDQTNFGRGGDRNLYINSLAYDGQTVTNGTTPVYTSPLIPPNGPYDPGNAVFIVNDTTQVSPGTTSVSSTTPGTVDVGSGADTATLLMSEDPYNGDAQFTVAVDGQQVGGTLTTTAISWEGQQQAFNIHGNWGSGAHTISVTYLTDRIGALGATGMALDNQDQNLYINAVSYDGIKAGGTPWELPNNGSQDFYVGAGGQPGNAAATTAPQSSQTTTSPTTIASTNTTTSPATTIGGDTSASAAATTTITPATLDTGSGMSFQQTTPVVDTTQAATASQAASSQPVASLTDIAAMQPATPAVIGGTTQSATAGTGLTGFGGGAWWSHDVSGTHSPHSAHAWHG